MWSRGALESGKAAPGSRVASRVGGCRSRAVVARIRPSFERKLSIDGDQPTSPNSRAISMRCTSLVPSPISRILESRHIRATGYSFMKP